MANEFIARKGLIALSDSQITGSLDVTGSLSITGISDVSASIAAAGSGSDFPYTGSAIISGSLEVIGKVTGSVLIEGSGSTLFEVVGSEGQLFSITDSLSGSLFAVSDVSGLPILEVFSDDIVKIGSFNNEAITVSGSHTTIGGVLAIPGFSDVSASLAASSIPAGTISSSAQVDHDATTNFSADEHFTQANITTVGTVTSGDVSAILPSGVLSGSAQIASDISGAFTAGGGISLSGGEFSVAAGTGLTQGATGLSFDADGGTLTTNNADVDHILINDGGTFKRITKGNINVGDFNNDAGYLTSSPFTAAGISGSFTSTSASIATDISNAERLSKGRITFLYTGSVNYAPPGYIAFLDQATDSILINTSSYNEVDLDASVDNDYSKFQFNEAGSLITVRKVSDGSFKTYKIISATTNYTGNADNVGYLVDGGSFANVMESGSISDGDEVEFIWDKSAGVGGAYGPTVNASAKTFAELYQGGYNYLDMFFGTAIDTEFDGSPENLSGVTVSSSFTDSSYFLPAISQSATLTLGGLTVNGTITGTINTSSITDFPTEVSRSAASAGFGSGGGGGSYHTWIGGRGENASQATFGTQWRGGMSGNTLGGSFLVSADTSIFTFSSGTPTVGDTVSASNYKIITALIHPGTSFTTIDWYGHLRAYNSACDGNDHHMEIWTLDDVNDLVGFGSTTLTFRGGNQWTYDGTSSTIKPIITSGSISHTGTETTAFVVVSHVPTNPSSSMQFVYKFDFTVT